MRGTSKGAPGLPKSPSRARNKPWQSAHRKTRAAAAAMGRLHDETPAPPGAAAAGSSTEPLDEELERAMSDLKQIKAYYKSDAVRSPRARATDEASAAPKPGEAQGADKLSVAEAVIRKLYKRNVELEDTLKDLSKHPVPKASPNLTKALHCPGRKSSSTNNSNNNNNTQRNDSDRSSSSSTDEADVDNRRDKDITDQENHESLINQQMEHLEFVVSERDRRIARLEATINQLKSRKASEESAIQLELGRRERRQKNIELDLQDAKAKMEHFREQSELMRASQGLRLGGKGDSKKLAALLTKQMDNLSNEHERERRVFNAKLERLEEENCSLFVENQSFRAQLDKVSHELAERDAVEAKIQQRVSDMFQHMKALETENKKLRQT